MTEQGRTALSLEPSTTDAGPDPAKNILEQEVRCSLKFATRALEESHSPQLQGSSATGGSGHSATVSSEAGPGGEIAYEGIVFKKCRCDVPHFVHGFRKWACCKRCGHPIK